MILDSICIVIPVYNGQDFIVDTIKSALQQSHKNVRLIVIDDGSTDHSLKEIIQCFGHNPRVCIKTQRNRGLPATLNSVLLALDTDFVVYLGQDDILPVDHCAIIVEQIKSLNADILFCNNYNINEFGEKSINLTLSDSLIDRQLRSPFSSFITKNFISVVGSIWSVKACKAVGGWEPKYQLFGEWLFYLKILKAGGRIGYTRKTVAYYRRHSTNNSSFLSAGPQRKKYFSYALRCRTIAFKEAPKTKANIAKYLRFALKDIAHLCIPNTLYSLKGIKK